MLTPPADPPADPPPGAPREASAEPSSERSAVPSSPGARAPVVGVLGGIASGKSRVARLIAGERGVVLDADRMVGEELASPEVVARIRGGFGEGLIGPDGLPDREALAELVFRTPGARELLEGWIHPRVRAKIRHGLAEAHAAGRAPVVLDVPLLLENEAEHGLARECDILVFVEAGLELRDRRAVEGRGWQPGEVERRERVQLPLAAKRARAHHVIANEGSLDELERSVNELRRRAGLP